MSQNSFVIKILINNFECNKKKRKSKNIKNWLYFTIKIDFFFILKQKVFLKN